MYEVITMISHENGIFHLKNDCFSYLLKINAFGLPEHLHFGPGIETEDAAAMCHVPGLGWGSSVVLDDSAGGSMQVMPLEWSGSGRGDYRESPLEMDCGAVDFRYRGFEILEGEATMECGLPQAHGAQQTLALHFAQPGAELTLYYCLFPTALTRRAVLKNTGEKELKLHKFMSFSLDLPGRFEMTAFHGGWIAEMRQSKVAVGSSRVVNESVTGFSSNMSNPGFLLSESGAGEEHGLVYGFNLVYSGNHYAAAQHSLQGFTRVMQGISPVNFEVAIAPGGFFETPEAVLSVSSAGFGGLSQQMHRFVNDHIIPSQWRNKPRPVLYNSWEGCMFDFSHRRLVSLAEKAKKLGCELFVLDDGWFGKRDNDLAGLGDYNVNMKKLPHGLSGLAKAVREKGMEFGLWFEPESVNPDSDLYHAHPDWALTDTFEPVLGRHQLLLDLTRPEVRDYIVENVSRVLDSAPITYVKWDMNRHSVAQGKKAHDYILGLYDVLRRIFLPRPHVLLESCSSGGNRFDLGMLCHSPQVWCSDNTDPIDRLTIQENLSYLYPQSTFGAHVSASPHAQTLRTTPLETRGNVSFFGLLGYELDLNHLLNIEQKQIQAQIAFYKQYRKIFQFGQFCRLENGWQVTDGKTAIAGVFHKLVCAAPAYERLKLKGLDKGKRYHLWARPQKLRLNQFGALVKHVAPVNLDPNGFLLRTADHYLTLEDGVEDHVVSGGALMAGIPLLPGFRGTGYDKNQHTQGDFGSALYVVEPVGEIPRLEQKK